MKKTIKTGLMIALFIVCLFLLLPFVVNERHNEQNPTQMQPQQPQVYSTNPLTALMQRVKDLFAPRREDATLADAKTQARKNGKNKKTRAAHKKQTGEHELATAANNRSGNAGETDGAYSPYSPQQYDFALYQNSAQGTPATANSGNAKLAANNSLFREAAPAEDSPTSRIMAFWKEKISRNSGKKIAAANTPKSIDSVKAADIKYHSATVATDSISNRSGRDTNQIINDIATLRANAKYPNPQTQAERLAREQMIKDETERYQKKLHDLYWKHLIHPDNPDDPHNPPSPEDFEANDPLADIIIDSETHSKVRATAFIQQDGEEDQSLQDAGGQGTPQGEQSGESASAADSSADGQSKPAIAVILGTTHEETLDKIQDELDFLEAQEKKEAQEGENGSDDEQAQNAQTNSEQNKENNPSEKYKQALETYKWLYSAAGCEDGCFWVAARYRENMQDLVGAITAAQGEFVGDPLGKEEYLFAQYVQEKSEKNNTTNTQMDKKADTTSQNDDEYDEEDDVLLADKSAMVQMAQDFNELTPYISYTREDMEQLKKKEQESGETQQSQQAQKGKKKIHYFVGNPFQAKQLDGVIDLRSMYVPQVSIEKNKTPQELTNTLKTAIQKNKEATQQADLKMQQDLSDASAKGVTAIVSDKLRNE